MTLEWINNKDFIIINTNGFFIDAKADEFEAKVINKKLSHDDAYINYKQRGDILFKDNNNYYIYGEEGNYYLVFNIYPNYILDSIELILNDKVYYALFDIETEKEIDIASAKRKSYKKELKNKVKYKSL